MWQEATEREDAIDEANDFGPARVSLNDAIKRKRNLTRFYFEDGRTQRELELLM